MAIIAGKPGSVLVVLVFTLLLTGCGLLQKVTEGTASATDYIFYKQTKTLHLDIRAREVINRNAAGVSLSTVVRIYQLRERRTFDNADYSLLFDSDKPALKSDLVAQNDIRLQPGGGELIEIPLEESAQYIAVAAMFISPDETNDTWRIVIARDELDADKPHIIVAGDNRLKLTNTGSK